MARKGKGTMRGEVCMARKGMRRRETIWVGRKRK